MAENFFAFNRSIKLFWGELEEQYFGTKSGWQISFFYKSSGNKKSGSFRSTFSTFVIWTLKFEVLTSILASKKTLFRV